METLVLNGSPRANGDTVSLVKALGGLLPGKLTVINAFSHEIAPCTDCRYCWKHPGCAKQDGWAEVDRALRTCDGVVLASPIYFSELTGPLLSVLSRLQQYYCARVFRGEESPFPRRKGGILLVGGGDGRPQRARETAETLLHQMGCQDIFPAIVCHNTNRFPALSEPGVREQLQALADFLQEQA